VRRDTVAILRKILYGSRKNKENSMSNNMRVQNLQDNYLNQLRKDKTPVVVYLTNGVRLRGVIKSFDSFVILLEESTQSLIYKHAVSTIVPEKNIEVRFETQQ
jgi:host factor-I protein